MDSVTANEFLASLKHDEKLLMLANIAYHLTEVARDTYSLDGGVDNPKRLRSINEVQHRTLAALRDLASGITEPRMSDEAIVALFFEERDDRTLASLLAFAFDRAARQTNQRSGEAVKASSSA